MPNLAFAPLPSLPTRVVVLMIGLPGSGKSTYLAHHGCPALATDELRRLLFDDAADQRSPSAVFALLRKILAIRLEATVPRTFVDATNLTPADRKPLIRLAEESGYPVAGIFMDVGVEECLQRNQRRERQLEEDVIRRMARRQRAPTAIEGVAQLYRISGDVGEWVY